MRASYPPLLLFFVIAITSCTASTSTSPPPGWQRVDAPHFSFHLPPDMRAIPVQGIDSVVAAYEGDSISLTFDYGSYSDPLDYGGKANHSVHEERIGGKTARIVSFDNPGSGHRFDYAIGAHFPEAGEAGVRLTVFVTCETEAGYEAARTIFRTIEFEKPAIIRDAR